ncbi:MAG: hypothetical protein ACRDP8_03120, partial [Actinopolymorphaceae bacterium]
MRTHPDAVAEYAAANQAAIRPESRLRAYSAAKARTVRELLERTAMVARR